MKKAKTKAEKEHLERVSGLPCVICGNRLVEVHHLRSGAGMGQRSSHFRVIPLCSLHHRSGPFGVAFHAGPREFQRRYGTEEGLLLRVLDALGMLPILE